MNPACTYRKILGQESGSGEKNRVVLSLSLLLLSRSLLLIKNRVVLSLT